MKIRKRSTAPIFWGLFGAGGMMAALFGPVLIFITGIAVPLGICFAPNAMSYQKMLPIAQNFIGKGFIGAMVVLFLWHAGHRIFHSLHEVGIHAGIGCRVLCYGIPLIATGVTGLALLLIWF